MPATSPNCGSRRQALMKAIYTLLAAGTIAGAATLEPGAEVTPDAITAATFLQGEAITEWEEDKLYFLECWASWCGPCVALIPKVNDWHARYYDQGLRVIGMNVWEDDEDSVKAFLAEKGDGMAFPVAFVGPEGAFEEQWLKAAGVMGIPHAFLVRNGTLLYSGHPMMISEAQLEGMLAGGDELTSVVGDLNAAQAAQAAQMAERQQEMEAQMQRLGPFIQQLEALMENEDHDGALVLSRTTLAENENLTDDDKAQIRFVKIMIHAEKGDFEASLEALDILVEEHPDSEMAQQQALIRQFIGEMRAEHGQTDNDDEDAGVDDADAQGAP